jgi:hypothetical protein
MDDILRVRYCPFNVRVFTNSILDTVTTATFSLIYQACSPRGIKFSSPGYSGEET